MGISASMLAGQSTNQTIDMNWQLGSLLKAEALVKLRNHYVDDGGKYRNDQEWCGHSALHDRSRVV